MSELFSPEKGAGHKDKVTDELSGYFQGASLCPVCEAGYLVTLKGKNIVADQDLDMFYERCINGCGSEQAGSQCVDKNAEIARAKGIGRLFPERL